MHRHRRFAVMLALVAAAVLPSSAAHAKGLTGLGVCGASECVDRTDEVRSHATLAEALVASGDSVADPGPAPFVRFKEHMGDGGEEFGVATVVYFPTLGIQRFDDGTFHRVTPRLRRSLARLVRGVKPWPAGRLEATEAPAAAADTAAPVGASKAQPPAPRGGAAAADGEGGGVPTVAWLGGAAAAILLALLGVAAVRRGGRPATG
jgi:hypothetical protein